MAKQNTRLKMIDAALDLFHAHGVNATSVDDVLRASRTGKSQFSHYFRTKEGLVHAVLTHLHELIASGKTPTGYQVRSWKDLDGWFKNYIEFQKSCDFTRSCPMGTIGADVAADQKLLRDDLRDFLGWSRGELTRFFSEKKASGELVASANPEALADLCISVMQGGMLLSKMSRAPHMFENASRQVLQYVRQLRT